jgi:chromosome partitioning protein
VAEPRKISDLNFKGGIGKTSLAINLADVFARHGKNVVLIDGDRQRNASTLIPGYKQDEDFPTTLKQVIMGECSLIDALYEARPGLYVCPAHRSLEQAAKHLVISGTRTKKQVAYQVSQLEGVDIVLFDHAPSYGPITDALLLASDEMLIPVELEAFSMEGLLDMIGKLTESLEDLEHSVAIAGIVPSNIDFTKSMTTVYLDSLRQTFAGRVFPSIRTDAQISRSQSMHQTVWEYNRHSKGAEDYLAVAQMLIGEEVLV